MQNQEFRNLIIKHYQEPQAFGFTNNTNAIKQDFDSEYCVDHLTLEIEFENNKIISARFEGVACTIATSATDLFCLEIINKTKKEAKAQIKAFEKLLGNREPKIESSLNELGYYGLIAHEPRRANCALIPTKILLKIFNT